MTRALSAGGYVVAAVAAARLLVAGHVDSGRIASLGRLLDVVVRSRSARIGLMLFWWWLGWHFLVAHAVT